LSPGRDMACCRRTQAACPMDTCENWRKKMARGVTPGDPRSPTLVLSP
jgi:hypothetical protein